MWLIENREVQEDEIQGNYGFIYEITNKANGRKYIGRKFFTKAGYKQIKGKRKKLRIASDWLDYYGSSDELSKDIEKFGKENFQRNIIRLCKTIGECKYWETKYQFLYNVLEEKLENGDFAYYNSNIAMKYTRRNIGKIG